MNPSLTDPSQRIGFLMWQTAHAFGQRMTQQLASLQLTPAQFGVLVHISREPGVSASELGRRLSLSRQGIRSALQPLLDRGAVVRRPHPSHGRAQVLFTTDTGAELAQAADALINDTESAMLAGFTADDRQRFATFVRSAAEAVAPTVFDRTSIRPHGER